MQCKTQTQPLICNYIKINDDDDLSMWNVLSFMRACFLQVVLQKCIICDAAYLFGSIFIPRSFMISSISRSQLTFDIVDRNH